MSTYVTLVNLLLTRLNEVPLDTAGDGFDSVRGVHALAKNAVNNSLRQIYQEAQEWPFLKASYVETLSAGTKEYAYPANYSSSDTDTFYLKKSSSLNNQARYIPTIGYEEYVKNFRAVDDEGKTGAPEHIYQTYENKFGVSPVPDQAYEVEYVYWSIPEDLSLYNDECVVPSRFNYIVIDGAMMYLMRFRSNDQGAATHQQSFDSGIKAMRRVLLDDPKHLRSTVISGRS
jgi:hypothetical protein